MEKKAKQAIFDLFFFIKKYDIGLSAAGLYGHGFNWA